MPSIRVAIADDEALMRSGLRVFVQSAEGLEVVGEAADGVEAVDLAASLHPDVMLMDMQMPRLDGVAATARVLEVSPETRVLAITTFSSERFLIPALRAGASAYLVKDTDPADLVQAIRDVYAGSCVISPEVTRALVDSVRAGGENDDPATAEPAAPTPAPRERAHGTAPAVDIGVTDMPCPELSDRELEVVRLLGRGLSNSEIAAELFLSEATVKTHLGRVMTKWGVRDRVQALIYAARADIIDLSA